jgi:hypothetical protein
MRAAGSATDPAAGDVSAEVAAALAFCRAVGASAYLETATPPSRLVT